ncbi:MAG TPA: GYF domain-containing protein [Polyangiaceae bacterium]|nr:GYF domain-containing protein [Polyangiaceae bacterium]
MVDSAEDAHFHWLASDGKQLSGSKRDLLTALREGTLSPGALVWRAGWAEWLPANRVAALAAAIPETKREGAREPKRDPAVLSPPAVPAERMSAVVPRAPVSAAPRTSVTPGRAQPPPAPVRARPSGAPASGGLPPLAPLAPPATKREPNLASPTAPQPNALHAPAPKAAEPNALHVPPPHAPALSVPAAEAHEAARDTLAPSSFGVIGTPRRTQPAGAVVRRDAAPVAAPVRARSPLPTLTEEGTVQSATATLRPPGAVPPPARGVPAVPALDSSGSFSFEKRSAAITPIPGFGPPGGSFETVPPAGLPPRLAPDPVRPSAPVASPAPHPALTPALTPALDAPAAAANALPPVVNKALLQDTAPRSMEPALDSTLEVIPKVPPEARRTPVEPMRAARPVLDSSSEEVLERALQRNSLVKIGRVAVDSRTVVMALSALCGALIVALIALFLTRAHSAEPEPTLAPSASAPPAPAPPPTGCRLAMPAALIAPNIERSVSPNATQVGTASLLALGFASTKTKGVGLRLNPDTLDTQPAFEEEGKDAVRGVVPLTRSGSLTFFVDRDDSALRSAHTVDEIPPFTLGVSDAGFSRVVAGNSSLVWPLDANLKITEPRAAAVGSFGYGVTFRRGGQSGAVLLGFVASDGAKKSELVEIPGAPKFLGTPVISGSAAGALVAFAGRDAPDAPWRVLVSLTKPGEAPGAARELVTGSGGGAISPTLSALAPNRWLVQWTEGVSGQYQVRVQSFAADLSAIGAPVLVSPKGANAGQGSLAAFSGGATTLFILTTAGHDELWGATLSCP